MVHILFVIGELRRAGAERQLVELATGLDRSRYRCIVCSLSSMNPLADELRQAGVEVVVLPKRLPLDITRIPRLVSLIHQEAVDIVHCYLITGNTWGRVAALLAPGRVVVASIRNAVPRRPRTHTWTHRMLAPFTDAFVVNASATKQILVKRYGVAAHRISVIHNGLDLEKFHMTVDVPYKRHELGLEPDTPTVGVVGRFHPQKDHRTFLEAARLVLKERSDVRFLCVGGGPSLAATKKLAADLGISSRVVFLGVRSDVPEIMYALDLLVLSSRWEGMPNVVMEAMAASRPVVATKVGGCPELVEEGKTGFLVSAQDPPALASAILEILGNHELADSMGRRGRKRIEESFNRALMVQRTQDLYEQLLGNDTRTEWR